MKVFHLGIRRVSLYNNMVDCKLDGLFVYRKNKKKIEDAFELRIVFKMKGRKKRSQGLK